ncbi:MAG: hypothetical protein IPO25_19715 [Saprospiraceae bacterium]|nr:hypothetical protein [Saprospiraceae bacterium]
MVILPISMCKFGVLAVEEEILRGMEMAAEAEAEAEHMLIEYIRMSVQVHLTLQLVRVELQEYLVPQQERLVLLCLGGYTTTTAAGGDSARTITGGTTAGFGTTSGLFTRTGGAGGNGTANGGGGGGGGSPTSIANGSAGSNGGGAAGGAGGTGEGAGGRGGDEDGSPDANAGNAPGGGGGGKGDDAGTSKSGANGRVIVTVTFYWESTKTLATIGGGGSAAETGCSALTTGVISTAVIMVPAGSNLTYRIGANAGEPVCSDNGGTAPFEAEEGIGLFASATSGGTQVYDSRLFTGAGPSNDPSNILPTGSGCIYNNNATSKYLTIKTIDATNNTASLPSQDEEVAYIAYEVISGNSGCINLPIQLTSFDVRLLHNTPLVEWTTMSELNNAYYSLERSSNGSDFKEITRIYGHGTTDRQNHYSYTDYNASNGLNYYRLTQVDLNGNYTTYHTISVFVPVEDFSVFPTFFSQEVTLQMPLPYDKPAAWVLYDPLVRPSGREFCEANLYSRLHCLVFKQEHIY